jgi:hypothetical protein
MLARKKLTKQERERLRQWMEFCSQTLNRRDAEKFGRVMIELDRKRQSKDAR